MKSIEREKVLRLNCPGFGEESHLNLGRAKSLDNYQVIIANPVSLLHLFDKGPEPTRRINQLLEEGVNQLNVPDDALIQELINESDSRLEELIPFLSQGGLLVYFLCRPFVLAGPSISVDNYDWLSVYAPASKSPDGTGSRQMSALSHGRVIESTDEGNTSEMSEYLEQSGVEWNTIIRTDFLSSNYSVLATAAQKKCIAAQFWAGDNGGKVIFLPAPYSPDFDRVLMVCVNKWYQEAINKGFIKDNSAIPATSEQEESPPQNSEKVPNHTMDEARLEEIMANLAANHQKKTDEAEAAANSAAASEGASPASAKAAPKGALKGLFSSDALDPFDDDEEFTTAAVLNEPSLLSALLPNNAPAATPPAAPLLTAEDILNSVTAEATKQAPGSFQEMEAIELTTDVTSEPVNVAEAPPQVALVNNFELKKATAEMDLSQFAETARQLVVQANQIETATREPVSASTANPKQRISDILKGLEFGGADDNDFLAAPEVTDVPSVLVNQTEQVKAAEGADSEAARLMESLVAGNLNENLSAAVSANVPSPADAETAKNSLTAAEIERAEIEAASRDLDSALRPGTEGHDRNWLDTGRYQLADEKQATAPDATSSNDTAAEAEAARLLAEQTASELGKIEAERASKTMEEFRQSFEFLTEEDPAIREYKPESALPEVRPSEVAETLAAEPEPEAAPVAASASTLPEPEIFMGAPKPTVVSDDTTRSTLRSLVDTFGAPRLDAPTSNEPKPDILPTPVAAHEEPMNTSFTSFEEEQLQAARDLAEIARLSKAVEMPVAAAPELQMMTNPAPAHVPAPQAPVVAAAPVEMAPSPAAQLSQIANVAHEPPAAPTESPTMAPPPAPMPVPEEVPAVMPVQAALPSPAPAPAPALAPTAMPEPEAAATPAAIITPPTVQEPLPVSAQQDPVSTSTNGDGNYQASMPPVNAAPAQALHIEPTLEQLSTPIPPKELIKKMEEMTKTVPPTWCDEFSFPFVDLLKNEHTQMAEQIRQMQARLSSVEARISAVESLKLILLTGENVALMSGTQEVLSRLGWQVQQSRSNINELWLSRGDQVEAIARIVHSPAGANRTEVAQLAESVISFWDEYETEPKGILIAQTWSSKHPSERSEPDFSPALQEFASKKHLSLMSTMQLLSMYKDVELNTMPVDEMRKRMLDTSGRLLGFPLDSNVAQAASGGR